MLTIGLLGLVFLIGHEAHGSQRWIPLGFFPLQPSELSKLTLVIVLAKLLSDHKDELGKLMGKIQQKGLTLIPTRLYFKNGRVKCELAVAKGKQLWDKRETERRRTAESEARTAIRNRKARE